MNYGDHNFMHITDLLVASVVTSLSR